MRGWCWPLMSTSAPSRPCMRSAELAGTRSTSRVEGDVADEQHPVRGHGQGRAAVHDERSGEAAEDLVGDGAVVVGVVPVGARRVVGGHADEVVEGGAGVDPQERVVAVGLRGDAQAVGVQVGGLVEPVGEPHGELVAGAHPQGGAGGGAVVAEGAGVAAREPDAGGGDQFDLQPALAAVVQRRGDEFGTGLARARPFARGRARAGCVVAIQPAVPARTRGYARAAEREGAAAADRRAHRRPSRRRRYSGSSISPRANRSSRICRAVAEVALPVLRSRTSRTAT